VWTFSVLGDATPRNPGARQATLQHVPVTLRNETKFDAELKGWLAYAEEKIAEVVTLRDLAAGIARPEAEAANRKAAEGRRASPRIHKGTVMYDYRF
jgi:5-methyltetrahydropteroyltriglutamate--homocysteine methyltransferase